jgi:trimeric autotransporter adhesin
MAPGVPVSLTRNTGVTVIDNTGAGVTSGVDRNSPLFGVNSAISQEEGTASNSGGHGSGGQVAGRSLFGTSPAAFSVGSATAGSSFGVSAKSFNAQMAPARPGRSSGGSRASGMAARAGGSSSSSLSASLSRGLPKAGSGAAPQQVSSVTSSISIKHGGKTAGSGGQNAGSDEKPASGVAAIGGGTYTESFPDSTKNTAELSPPDTDQSPFRSPPEELAFPIADLSNMEFLRIAIKAGGHGGAAQEKADIFQRFLNRLNSEHGSSTGLTKSFSPYSPASALGTHLNGEMGLKPSASGLGQGMGLQSSMPY